MEQEEKRRPKLRFAVTIAHVNEAGLPEVLSRKEGVKVVGMWGRAD